MEFILKDQSVQFTFAGEKYTNGKKNRILKNVKKAASAEDVMKVGKALSKLQKDDGVKNARLISYSDIQA
ncbi:MULTISPECIES: DUF1659 domain-containing protein [Lactobacillus]|uniref:DUF1659 domain-containing protein n=1 Tax=Lactobacillus TaxID=1578 RepID=UPI0023BE240C|nr:MULTISPECIES: hypothetical protein [Lactobacillus]MDE6546390.1 hypothetical protein [Lactobacillus sp.]MDE7050925.1 hypothetical protein [Lactobacillus sp.]